LPLRISREADDTGIGSRFRSRHHPVAELRCYGKFIRSVQLGVSSKDFCRPACVFDNVFSCIEPAGVAALCSASKHYPDSTQCTSGFVFGRHRENLFKKLQGAIYHWAVPELFGRNYRGEIQSTASNLAITACPWTEARDRKSV